MELLAPVGGMDQLKAALRFGANAVYGGMKEYGLRAFAGNFSMEELQEGCRLAHEAGVKFYVTMNILPRDSEMEGFLRAAETALQARVDAAIVSDFGAALMLHEKLPELAIHISTQANILNSRTAEYLHQSAGAERIVLSRELTLEEISIMRKNLPKEIELEAFIHGAMCVAYSGRCLLSAALTGRSGNRGACAQPCRWKYAVAEEKRPDMYLPLSEDDRGSYLFSAYDLCMMPHLTELQRAGVSSLKIEGRMKTAYYVATVVSAYRKALDLLELEGEEAYQAALPDLMEELQKASHRASNTGFYFGKPENPAGADGFSQSMQYIGDIIGREPDGSTRICLKNRFYAGDQLEVLTPHGVRKWIAPKFRNAETGEELETASVAGCELLMDIPVECGAGDILRGPNRNHQK